MELQVRRKTMKQEILSLEAVMALRESAPIVTVPSYEAARAMVKALAMYSAGNASQKDMKGITYWRCALAELLALIDMPAFTPHLAGGVCRSFQLTMKRENDGFYVAWSQTQLDILSKHVK
jgi:hypothetical protein